ncbi:MAG TPA: tetratricopeptide repeat protein [Nitrososphaeraceae archaeon]|nr:tetratricopeptide repeat protein [Nitrososphaeraceae archaeon]
MIETSRLTFSKNLYTVRMDKLAKSFVISLPIFVLSFISILGYPAHAFGTEFELSNWYDKALSINQNNVPALVQKGTELVNQGDGEQAITWLDKALSLDPTNLMALVSKGAALRDMGKYQEAIVTYDKVLTIDPNDVYAIGGKANSLYGSGQPEQAIIWIDKALQLNPSDGKIQQVKESLQNVGLTQKQ